MIPTTEHPFNFEAGEILNVNKPKGMTSFRVVQHIRNWTQCKKVGHAGTLDPLATGVLIVCTGRGTKRISEFVHLDKEYEGTIELGLTTDTDDAEGRPLEKRPVPNFTSEEIENILNHFRGEILQVPPMYSALKKNGKRLYRMARKGIVVEREPRKVTIFQLEKLSWKKPFLGIRVCCSKGTYIRSLARDIGERLKTGGYLTELCRTRIGPYHLQESYSLDALKGVVEAVHAGV